MESNLLIEEFIFDLTSLNAKALEEKGTLWEEIQSFLLGYYPDNMPALDISPWHLQVCKGQLESLKYDCKAGFSLEELQKYSYYQDLLKMDLFFLGYLKDRDFLNFLEVVKAKLKARVDTFTVSYSKEEWNIDIEEFLSNSLLALKLDTFKVEIHDSYILFPNGVKVQTFTPSKLQENLLNIICEDHYDDSDFGSIIDIIKPITEEQLPFISDIAYNTSFPASSIFSHAEALRELAELKIEELGIITKAIAVLNDEWHGSGEELIQTAKVLILQK